MPDGFEPTDEIEIEMSILYGMSVWAQDEKNVYHEYMMTPGEPRHLPPAVQG